MKTERELFWAWVNEENPVLVREARDGSQFHKDVIDYMFMGWEASVKRDGFVLVPVEPTLKMVRASEHIKSSKTIRQDIYKAMIEAANEN